MDLWNYLFEASLTNVFGNAVFLGIVVLIFMAVMLFFSNASKVFIMPLLLIFSYGLLQYGLIPMALFGGILVFVGFIFAVTVLNAVFGQ